MTKSLQMDKYRRNIRVYLCILRNNDIKNFLIYTDEMLKMSYLCNLFQIK